MDYVIAIAPSIGLGILFFIVIRAFITADRRERVMDAEIRKEIEQRLRKEAEDKSRE